MNETITINKEWLKKLETMAIFDETYPREALAAYIISAAKILH